jgi:hypothetical protein
LRPQAKLIGFGSSQKFYRRMQTKFLTTAKNFAEDLARLPLEQSSGQ